MGALAERIMNVTQASVMAIPVCLGVLPKKAGKWGSHSKMGASALTTTNVNPNSAKRISAPTSQKFVETPTTSTLEGLQSVLVMKIQTASLECAISLKPSFALPTAQTRGTCTKTTDALARMTSSAEVALALMVCARALVTLLVTLSTRPMAEDALVLRTLSAALDTAIP